MLTIWLAVCALMMLAALADAACLGRHGELGRVRKWPPSLSTVMVTS